jgi:hypothetical protein
MILAGLRVWPRYGYIARIGPPLARGCQGTGSRCKTPLGAPLGAARRNELCLMQGTLKNTPLQHIFARSHAISCPTPARGAEYSCGIEQTDALSCAGVTSHSHSSRRDWLRRRPLVSVPGTLHFLCAYDCYVLSEKKLLHALDEQLGHSCTRLPVKAGPASSRFKVFLEGWVMLAWLRDSPAKRPRWPACATRPRLGHDFSSPPLR